MSLFVFLGRKQTALSLLLLGLLPLVLLWRVVFQGDVLLSADIRPQFIYYSPSYAKLDVTMDTSGLLVMSDLYYPGWKVYVDGIQEPLYVTNLIMRGVFLPAGFHQVEFIYRPGPFRIGLIISLATMLFIITLLFVKRGIGRKNSVLEEN